MFLENRPKKIRTLIGLKLCFYYTNTEQAGAVDVMMALTKRIYILMIKVNKLFSLFLSNLLKEIENMFSVFLSISRNAPGSLRELEKAVETLVCGSCSHSISRSPKLPLVFL